ncbi:MAG TPA: crotonase/enoyl-CoA hydratase family protein [Thermoanaerobaculia bacterium]|nr:crotonase/enoyl-CoA hydratase family protein [Thermoanaerobaculia bacterium]
MSSAVRSEKSGPITTVILDRPAARNAVDRAAAEALVEAFLAFEHDPAAAAAVFWGAGGAFCAGFDLKYVAATGGAREWLAELRFPAPGAAGPPPPPPGPMGPSRLALTKPVIAAVSGPAVAGGMELALWCDLRVMEESAFFGVYSRRWGVPLIDGGTVRLPRLVGEGRALEIILTGRQVPAAEALAIGLCERVVPDGTARAAAEELARQIARFPQTSLRADRAAVHRQHGLPLHEALRQEFERGEEALRREGVAGAGRFAGGKGRHGDQTDI